MAKVKKCIFCEIVAGRADAYRVYEDALHIFLVPTVGGDVLERFFNALEKVQESPHELVRHRKKSALTRPARKLRKL